MTYDEVLGRAGEIWGPIAKLARSVTALAVKIPFPVRVPRGWVLCFPVIMRHGRKLP